MDDSEACKATTVLQLPHLTILVWPEAERQGNDMASESKHCSLKAGSKRTRATVEISRWRGLPKWKENTTTETTLGLQIGEPNGTCSELARLDDGRAYCGMERKFDS